MPTADWPDQMSLTPIGRTEACCSRASPSSSPAATAASARRSCRRRRGRRERRRRLPHAPGVHGRGRGRCRTGRRPRGRGGSRRLAHRRPAPGYPDRRGELRQARRSGRLVPPDGPDTHSCCSPRCCPSSATSASCSPGTPGSKKTPAAPPPGSPRKPGAADARPSQTSSRRRHYPEPAFIPPAGNTCREHRRHYRAPPGQRHHARSPSGLKVTSNKRNRHDIADSHRRATMRTGISDPT